jgi:hypothetical protein
MSGKQGHHRNRWPLPMCPRLAPPCQRQVSVDRDQFLADPLLRASRARDQVTHPQKSLGLLPPLHVQPGHMQRLKTGSRELRVWLDGMHWVPDGPRKHN